MKEENQVSENQRRCVSLSVTLGLVLCLVHFFCASLKNHYLCSDSPLSSYTNAKMSYEVEAPLLNQSHMRLK